MPLLALGVLRAGRIIGVGCLGHDQVACLEGDEVAKLFRLVYPESSGGKTVLQAWPLRGGREQRTVSQRSKPSLTCN